MSIVIEKALCNGCGLCFKTCPMDVFRLDKKTKIATVAYIEDCKYCLWCAFDCPTKAISITLAPTEPGMLSWG